MCRSKIFRKLHEHIPGPLKTTDNYMHFISNYEIASLKSSSGTCTPQQEKVKEKTRKWKTLAESSALWECHVCVKCPTKTTNNESILIFTMRINPSKNPINLHKHEVVLNIKISLILSSLRGQELVIKSQEHNYTWVSVWGCIFIIVVAVTPICFAKWLKLVAPRFRFFSISVSKKLIKKSMLASIQFNTKLTLLATC